MVHGMSEFPYNITGSLRSCAGRHMYFVSEDHIPQKFASSHQPSLTLYGLSIRKAVRMAIS